jgi:hypothetical protein
MALFDFDFFAPLPIQVEVSDAPLSSDAGRLPLRQCDERIGWTKPFAAVLDGRIQTPGDRGVLRLGQPPASRDRRRPCHLSQRPP